MVASIHGRFQPFHNGHLSYFMKALEREDHIFIGITNCIPPSFGSEVNLRDGLHSGTDEANPFTFFDRLQIVEAGVRGAGVKADKFTIIPFPIELIQGLIPYFPLSGVCYTTIKDEWNIKKIRLLQSIGYRVEVIEDIEDERNVYASGSQIRLWARNSNDKWREAIPNGSAEIIDIWRKEDPDRIAAFFGNR